METLNRLITEAGFTEQLAIDLEPKIVVGYVKTCEPHPDSDHLSVTETEVGEGEVLQIVCGAANIRKGLKVVVAKPGAMMPDGLLIWPGTLRGVDSYGMICSARELHLANAPLKKEFLNYHKMPLLVKLFQLENNKKICHVLFVWQIFLT